MIIYHNARCYTKQNKDDTVNRDSKNTFFSPSGNIKNCILHVRQIKGIVKFLDNVHNMPIDVQVRRQLYCT